MDSIQCGDSHVGEIFDIYKMYQIAKKNFPSDNVQIVDINGIDELDEQLENNFVIYPCNSKGTPHYCFLENKTENNYIYRQFYFYKKRKMDKNKFYQWNKELGDIPIFTWKEYYDKKGGLRIWLCSILSMFFQIPSDFRLSTFLRKNEKLKRNELYNEKMNVNMCGKILVISKNVYTSHQN